MINSLFTEPGHRGGRGLCGGEEVPREAGGGEGGVLDGQAEAGEVAKDIRGHAHVLEELAHGVLRLQVMMTDDE